MALRVWGLKRVKVCLGKHGVTQNRPKTRKGVFGPIDEMALRPIKGIGAEGRGLEERRFPVVKIYGALVCGGTVLQKVCRLAGLFDGFCSDVFRLEIHVDGLFI